MEVCRSVIISNFYHLNKIIDTTSLTCWWKWKFREKININSIKLIWKIMRVCSYTCFHGTCLVLAQWLFRSASWNLRIKKKYLVDDITVSLLHVRKVFQVDLRQLGSKYCTIRFHSFYNSVPVPTYLVSRQANTTQKTLWKENLKNIFKKRVYLSVT